MFLLSRIRSFIQHARRSPSLEPCLVSDPGGESNIVHLAKPILLFFIFFLLHSRPSRKCSDVVPVDLDRPMELPLARSGQLVVCAPALAGCKSSVSRREK